MPNLSLNLQRHHHEDPRISLLLGTEAFLRSEAWVDPEPSWSILSRLLIHGKIPGCAGSAEDTGIFWQPAWRIRISGLQCIPASRSRHCLKHFLCVVYDPEGRWASETSSLFMCPSKRNTDLAPTSVPPHCCCKERCTEKDGYGRKNWIPENLFFPSAVHRFYQGVQWCRIALGLGLHGKDTIVKRDLGEPYV